MNRTFVSEWPSIGQVVLPLSECRGNCSHRGLCMLWTGAPPDKGGQHPRCECYYGYRSRAIGPAGDFLVRTLHGQHLIPLWKQHVLGKKVYGHCHCSLAVRNFNRCELCASDVRSITSDAMAVPGSNYGDLGDL